MTRDSGPAATHTVALAGNPNSGKTSIFNALTGAHRRVSNYAGVTVEKRQGVYEHRGARFELIDLPGTYSLCCYSPEERIAQAALLDEPPDVVVVVVDSGALKRSLVLLSQIMQLGANLVLCLNMADEAAAAGQELDMPLLRQLLGFPVVETVGHRGLGLDELRGAIADAVDAPLRETRLVLGQRLERALQAIGEPLADTDVGPAGTWVATRLLLGDADFVQRLRAEGSAGEPVLAAAAAWRAQLEAETGRDVALYVAECYGAFVDGLLREVTRRPRRDDARASSDRIDALLAHRLLGLPLFFAAMYGVFWISFTVGERPMGWIESGVAWLAASLNGLWPAGGDSPLRSLLVEGVLGGVGGVIVFLPNIVLLFLCLSLLEDSGYMARAAFLVDHFMHRFGLHGRSFIPLMTGFGCSVPGIMATRTLENGRDRLATMLVLPLMSCGARLPIWMLLIPAFFAPAWRAPLLWTIYLVGVLLALLLVLLLRRSLLRGEDAPFVMELPPYRVPTLRAISGQVRERSWLYLRKAGTVILAISILMWAITSYPKAAPLPRDPALSPAAQQAQQAAADLQASLAARIGRGLEPLIAPLGFDWRIGTALVGAFAAKEVFVAQLGIVNAVGDSDGTTSGLRAALRRDYAPLTGMSLMLFLLIGTPCMATFAVTRRESGSTKWALLQFFGLTLVAYLASLTLYQIGRLLG